MQPPRAVLCLWMAGVCKQIVAVERMTIGVLVAHLGQKTSGSVPIGTGDALNTPVSHYEIPITIVNGIDNGPTVLVVSGIHGSEYTPILASQRLARELDPARVRGCLILVHVANLPSYLGRTVYTSPADGKNLNRVFPGNPNGTLSEKIANYLVKEVYPLADYVLDMHSGDGNEQLAPSYTAYYGKAGSPEVIRASKDMAKAFGLDLILEFQWEIDVNETSNAIWAGSAAVVRTIPAIDVELAPGMGSIRSASVERAYNGVLRVMKYLGLLQRNPETDMVGNAAPCFVVERYFIEAPVTGSWVPLVDAGAFVKAGTALGYITDFYGREKIYNVTAPGDGLLLIRFQTPPVVLGDTVMVMAVLNESDAACDHLRQSGLLARDTETNNVALWKWTAAIGWLCVLFSFLGMLKGRRQLYYQLHIAEDHPLLGSPIDDGELRPV